MLLHSGKHVHLCPVRKASGTLPNSNHNVSDDEASESEEETCDDEVWQGFYSTLCTHQFQCSFTSVLP